jgi:hypothetical protein
MTDNKIIFKHSSGSTIPSASTMEYGEVYINHPDGFGKTSLSFVKDG